KVLLDVERATHGQRPHPKRGVEPLVRLKALPLPALPVGDDPSQTAGLLVLTCLSTCLYSACLFSTRPFVTRLFSRRLFVTRLFSRRLFVTRLFSRRFFVMRLFSKWLLTSLWLLRPILTLPQ